LPGLRASVYTLNGRVSSVHWVSGDYDGVLQQDVDGDGAVEWLVNCVTKALDEDRGRLVCLEPDGRLRWEFHYGAAQTWRGRALSSNYVGLLVRPVSTQGGRYILTVANHAVWFPSQVALLDPATGHALEQYWHPGGLFRCKLHDFDGDGEPEALLAGVNNPGEGLGYGALVLLSLPFSKAGRRVVPETPDFWNSTGVSEMGYVLFPRPDSYDTVGYVPVLDTVAVVDRERLLVKLTKPGEGSFFYYLDFSMKLVECRVSEDVAATHRRLAAAGELDHQWSDAEARSLCRIRTFPAAPDGNSPEVVRWWASPPGK
jgi:hypothetical protein